MSTGSELDCPSPVLSMSLMLLPDDLLAKVAEFLGSVEGICRFTGAVCSRLREVRPHVREVHLSSLSPKQLRGLDCLPCIEVVHVECFADTALGWPNPALGFKWGRGVKNYLYPLAKGSVERNAGKGAHTAAAIEEQVCFLTSALAKLPALRELRMAKWHGEEDVVASLVGRFFLYHIVLQRRSGWFCKLRRVTGACFMCGADSAIERRGGTWPNARSPSVEEFGPHPALGCICESICRHLPIDVLLHGLTTCWDWGLHLCGEFFPEKAQEAAGKHRRSVGV